MAPKVRRSSQDFSRLDRFLTPEQWTAISDLRSSRERAERMSEIGYGMGLRLPTEQTFGTWTGLLALMEQNDNLYHLHVLLGTVKSAWKAVYKRSSKFESEEERDRALLPVLPNDWEGLPPYAQQSQGLGQPLPESRRPYTERQILQVSSKVILRGNHSALVPVPTRGLGSTSLSSFPTQFAWGVEQLGRVLSAPRADVEVNLPGFKLLSPSKSPSKTKALCDAEKSEACNVSGSSSSAQLPPTPAILDRAAVQEADTAQSSQPVTQEASLPTGPMDAGVKQDFGGLQLVVQGNSKDEGGLDKQPCEAYESQVAAVEANLRARAQKAGVMVRPAAAIKRPASAAAQEFSSSKQQKAASSASKASCKKPAAAESEDAFANELFVSKVWGDCKAEYYSHKSYIRHKVDGAFKLVIGTQGQGHKADLAQLVKHVKAGRSKEELLKIRAKILESLPA